TVANYPGTGYSGGVLTLTSGGPNAANSLAIDTSGAAGTLDLNGHTMTFVSGGVFMNGSNTYTIRNGQFGASSAPTPLFIHQTATAPLVITATLSGGTGSVVKDGSGALTLSGSNSFSGGFTLAAGQLNINSATALGTGALTIGGSGTIDNTSGGPITLANN